MDAVILAGGLGKRLKPFTEVIPKPLLPIGEKSVLEIQITLLKKHGFDRIFLATNYKSEYIESFFGDGSRYGIEIFVSKEETPLGTVGPLLLLQEQLKNEFLVINGDILTLCDFSGFMRFAKSKAALLTVGVKELTTPFQFGNIFFEGDDVVEIQEKPLIKTNILAGVYVFSPAVFELIPPGVQYDMDNLINDMLKQKKIIKKFDIHEYWLDIGRVDDYHQAQLAYKDHFEAEMD
ncbi:MAG: NTP transferase domain-containing protein [Ignavibacteriaceae bacterium]|nr:MAG: NTP transferase domain-containing protein [Ignavibacteriaceae bacterium]MBV6445964.1 UTP--glucose-1-phosphate uridylyltransferase [Ignavibacteriaceae bacterium]MBW7873535.1 NTP transferase domain-containing protein [Ignavibacteria bacterium]OQY69923.1 MAG: mannose-1-phosphate guanyltransferase [Ignavibacteriales bacterium UTCHB2]WKZ72811.1 MAG: sugar phosphate nucleotidyltransferase [Ignavibacteriaceae bacterium]